MLGTAPAVLWFMGFIGGSEVAKAAGYSPTYCVAMVVAIFATIAITWAADK